MNAHLSDSRSRREVEPQSVLDLLAQSETPALATDCDGNVVFWNYAAERVFGRTSNQVLGRRCFEMVGGRDVFGNRFCHENCAVLAPPLTAREREILRLVMAGLQNKEIAEELGLSTATVRNHVHHILEKLEVHSKLEAASLAFRQGWVTA